MDDSKLPNGGFPPILECLNEINKKIKKERYLQPNMKNININKILNTKKNKLNIIENDDELIELEEV
jgi:hypothetical protein